jgi:hypothetical protein
MFLKVDGHPADPECLGHQWFIIDEDGLAELSAEVLIGRAEHAARILAGVQRNPGPFAKALKPRLQQQLLLPPDADPAHRDGLLFEIICWLVARMTADPDEIVSDPHLRATTQGSDTLKISFDQNARLLVAATVYEYKCTIHARDRFRDEVLPAFQEYFDGRRDDQLAQNTVALLTRYELSNQELVQVYDDLLTGRPIRFEAALTVSPEVFPKKKCIKLFKDYSSITPLIDHRFGNTLPLANIRDWFQAFAQRVWAKIEAFDV